MSALPMRKDAAPPAYLPRSVAVLGFARSGRALADALRARGIAVSVADARSASELPGVAEAAGRGVRFFLGEPGEALGVGVLEGADWLAVSPGVPLETPVVAAARARGIPVLAELEVAYRIAQAETAAGANRWIAITGTNGKSTTTTWIAEMLRRAGSGRTVVLAGNIGAPVSEFLGGDARGRDFVCEASSFQLETIDRFRPDVAVLTNVTPDHLDRYAGLADYAAAKARIFARQEAADFAVVNADDPVSLELAAATRAKRILFSRRGRPAASAGAWVEAGTIFANVDSPAHAVLPVARLALPGAHNLENALAAVAAAEALGTPAGAIVDALTRFEGLPHRTQLVAEGGGVRWVDDSKGTNVDATLKSLEGFPDASVILILGGRDKHGDFAALAALVSRRARAVLTIGEAAPTIEAALAGAVSIERCGTMAAAVSRAAELARPGDTVLLSPACASFDQYRNFEERGRDFAALALRAADSDSGSRSHDGA
jgi:UDP-N-acetylmuramoylalanine--D-glutamate ligase